MVYSSRFVFMSSQQIHEVVANAVPKRLIFCQPLLGIQVQKPRSPDKINVFFKVDLKAFQYLYNTTFYTF